MTSKWIYVSRSTVYGLQGEVSRDAVHGNIVHSSTCAAHISQVDWKAYQTWIVFGDAGVLYKRSK